MKATEKLKKQITELEEDIQEAYYISSTATNYEQKDAYFNRFMGLTIHKEALEEELNNIQEIEEQLNIIKKVEEITK